MRKERTLEARVESTCPNCEHTITTGTKIRRQNGVGFVHVNCPGPSVLTAKCGGYTSTAGHACWIRTKPGERCQLHADQRMGAGRVRLVR